MKLKIQYAHVFVTSHDVARFETFDQIQLSRPSEASLLSLIVFYTIIHVPKMVAHDHHAMATYRVSPPSSPSPQIIPQASPQPPQTNDSLDDIFGSDSDEPRESPGGNEEWSDIPRLREKHETEGYRDGVAQGKATTVQKGFDEGYHLGAVLGLRIGKILGIIEGIHRALVGVGEEGERLGRLLKEAREELKTESVFGRAWWGEDGIWTFEVDGKGDEEVTFEDVVGQHPVVVKWEEIIAKEIERWEIDLDILAGEEEGAREADMPEKDLSQAIQKGQKDMAPGAAKELSW